VCFQKMEVPDSYWGSVKRSDPWGVFTQQPVGCRAFVNAILEDRPVTPTFYDGYKAQEVIGAALESHQTGKWMTVKDLA